MVFGGVVNTSFLEHAAGDTRWKIKQDGLWTITAYVESENGAVNERMLHHMRLRKHPATTSLYGGNATVVYGMGVTYYRDDRAAIDNTVMSGTVTAYFHQNDELDVQSLIIYRENAAFTKGTTITKTFLQLECVH